MEELSEVLGLPEDEVEELLNECNIDIKDVWF